MTQYPYFRVTPEQTKVEDLDSWFKHFEDLGTPCAIVQEPSNHYRSKAFTLWRIGEEANSIPKTCNNEAIAGEIVKECHGFGELAKCPA